MKLSVRYLFAAALAVLSVSSAFASDIFLKIESVKGKSQIVKLRCADGTCATSVDGMKAGSYTFTLCDAHGTALKVKEKANRTKSLSMNYTKIVFEYSLSKKNDAVVAGSNIISNSTKPISLQREIQAGGTFVAAGDVDGDGRLDLKISWTQTGGGISAEDDWEAPVK